MREWLSQLDDLLRGKTTGPELLAGGRVDIPLKLFLLLALVLGAVYGFFMGWFSLGDRGFWGVAQLIASAVKLPLLFLLTLVVTFPSLYVFNALVGCRLDFMATLRLLVAAIVVNLAVAASLGPILGFFTVSTTSYTFMVLLNVLLLTIAGVIGLGFLLQTLRRLSAPPPGAITPVPTTSAIEPLAPAAGPEAPAEGLRRTWGPLEAPPGPLPEDRLRSTQSIFRVWVLIYALVGAQMGWILRPFIGDPKLGFQLFRQREGNFFQSVFHHFASLFNAG
ncbi:MAG: hypothetical protein AMXMBFR13_11930 [Phycisphaerae bacterium]